MLVLSRKFGERIMIGDRIVLQVVDIDRGKIRLGICAPRDMEIWREELLPPGHPLSRTPIPPTPPPAE